MAWRCAICLIVLSITLRHLLCHINEVHSQDLNFLVVCGIDDCPSTFRRYNSFYRHVIRSHSPIYYGERYAERLHERAIDGPNVGQGFDHDIDVQQVEQDEEEPPIMEPVNVDIQPPPLLHNEAEAEECQMSRRAVQFVIGLKNKHSLTQAATNDVVNGCNRLIHQTMEKLKADIMTEIQGSGLDQDAGISQIIEDVARRFTSPLSKMHSAYQQEKAMKSTFCYIEPVEVCLGETYTRKRKFGQLDPTVLKDTFYYIPIKQSIQQWLENDRLYGMLSDTPNSAPNGYVVDMCDGDFFKKHPILSQANSLGFLLYFDDVEICNPLGSKAHKLSMFYYTLTNIPLMYRSKLPAIRLLACAERKVIDKYGIDTVLHPFVEEMKLFANGINLDVQGLQQTFYGALLSVVGDTPASNQMGGFKEGVGGAYRKCRQCMCNEHDIQLKFNENDFVCLDKEAHERRCLEIERADTQYMKNYLSTLYGINRRSALLDCPHFDISICLPQDIMHVVFEGIAQYEVKELLKFYIFQSRTFSLATLNEQIDNFVYGYIDVSAKPTLLHTLHTEDSRLKQSSSQTLVLLKILPFILSSLIDTDTEHYTLFIELLEIINIIMSPVLSYGTLSNLKTMVTDHLSRFKRLFPQCNIIPKHHYLLHLPSCIKRFGPAVRYWCMRFEGKHVQHKTVAKNQNFINLPKSVAKASQTFECMSTGDDPGGHPIFSNEKDIGKSVKLDGEEDTYVRNNIKRFTGTDDDGMYIYRCKGIQLNGFSYKIKQSFVIVEATEMHPCFGCLSGIYVCKEGDKCETIFQVQMYDTVLFKSTLQAYLIEAPQLAEGHVWLTASSLLNAKPYSSVNENEHIYIPISHDLTDMIQLYKDHRLKI